VEGTKTIFIETYGCQMNVVDSETAARPGGLNGMTLRMKITFEEKL